MEELQFEFQQKITQLSLVFQRYLVNKVELKNRLIAVKGARGSGKTTLLLQIAKQKFDLNKARKTVFKQH